MGLPGPEDEEEEGQVEEAEEWGLEGGEWRRRLGEDLASMAEEEAREPRGLGRGASGREGRMG